MPDHDWLHRQKTLADELIRLAERRRAGLARLLHARVESEQIAFEDFKERTRVNLKTTRARRERVRRIAEQRSRLIQTAIHDRRATIKAEGISVRETASHKQVVLRVADDVEEKADEDLQEALWSAVALFEGGEAGAFASYKTSSGRLDEAMELILRIRGIRDWKVSSYPSVRRAVKFANTEPPRLTGGDLSERLAEAQRLLEQLGKHEPSPSAYWPVLVAPIVFGGVVVYPAISRFGPVPGIVATMVMTAIVTIFSAIRTRAGASRPMTADVIELDRTLLEAEAAHAHKTKRIEKRLRHRRKQNALRRKQQEKSARAAFARIVKPEIEPLDSREQVTLGRLKKRLEILDRARKHQPIQAQEQLARRLETINAQHRRDRLQSRDDYRALLDVIAQTHRADVADLDQNWEEGWARVCKSVAMLERESQGANLAWSSCEWSDWIPPTSFPRSLRIGEIEMRIDLGADRRGPTASIPIVIPCSEPGHLILAPSRPDDRSAAIGLMNSMMLRFLTSWPAAKLVVTILDPVGRGAGFEPFRTLAEQTEGLINEHVESDPESISALLNDLQESLDNRDSQVDRLLVIADFPVGFDESSIERLGEILSAGRRARLFTLFTVDPSTPIDTIDLGHAAAVFKLADGKIHAALPGTIDLDPAADADLTASVLATVARAAAEASSPMLRVLS